LEFTWDEFLRLLRVFLKQRRNKYYFTREEFLAFAVSRGYNISYYSIRKLLKRATREGLLQEYKKKDTKKSYEWGFPIYRTVYIPTHKLKVNLK